MDLTVLLLARNEEPSLARLFPALKDALRAFPGQAEVLVLDGRSEDGTREVSRTHGARVIVQREPGYGAAFREGLEAARGDHVVSIDADGSHDPRDILRLYARRTEAELVIGSRYCRGGRYGGQRFRHALSRVLNSAFRTALALPFRDVSSGFRLYATPRVRGLDLRGKDFDVLEEALVLLRLAGCRIVEVPILFRPRESGVSKSRLLHLGREYLRTLGRLRALAPRAAP